MAQETVMDFAVALAGFSISFYWAGLNRFLLAIFFYAHVPITIICDKAVFFLICQLQDL